MQQVQKDASVHHKTVTEVSKNPPKRKRKAPTKRETNVVEITRTDERVWKAAVKAAKAVGLDSRHVDRIDAEHVVVRNYRVR